MFAFWLLASGPSPNFSLSQSPSPSAAAAPVVLFRVRYSSAARVLCPFIVFFFLSLFLSDLRFRFPSFFFFSEWSGLLVLIPFSAGGVVLRLRLRVLSILSLLRRLVFLFLVFLLCVKFLFHVPYSR